MPRRRVPMGTPREKMLARRPTAYRRALKRLPPVSETRGEYLRGMAGRGIRSRGLGRGLGIGAGRGPIGRFGIRTPGVRPAPLVPPARRRIRRPFEAI